MPKINKDTLKILPRSNVWVYKFENKNTYFCRFYIGKIHSKSGRFEKSLKTKNINEAITKANEFYRNWFIDNKNTTVKILRSIDLDIAQPFLRYRTQKYKDKTSLKDNTQAERDTAKWENYLKSFFVDIDYQDVELVENIINDEVVSHLKEDGRSGSTINKYMSLITQMFKRGQNRGVVKTVPDTPTQEVIDTPRLPYSNQELNLINRRCDEEFNKTKDKYYLGMKDCLNLTRSGGFRPGLEVLNLKVKDYKYLTDANSSLKVLEFTVYNTKTKPIHKVTCNPFFTTNIFPEIKERNSNLKDNDYLLFPDVKDRTKLKNKVGKIFVRFSKELNLYFKDGGTRPLYSVRHTYATELYKKGATIDDIATLMNTSPKMILTVYLGLADQTLVNRHKRVYETPLKIIK